MVQFVGIGEMKISDGGAEVLTASNLGSCLGLTAYDPVRKRGGMIHCLLPLSKSDPEKAQKNPYLYVDSGVPLLIENLLSHGASKKEIVLMVAGCANINDDNNIFEIGKKNYTIMRKILWKNNLLIRAEHVGESFGRTMSLDIQTGQVTIRANGTTFELK